MRTTREVTKADLAKARRIHAQLESSERKATTSRDIAQAIANIQWAIDKCTSDWEAEFALASN